MTGGRRSCSADARNSCTLLGPEFCNADLGEYLTDQFAGEHLDRYTLAEPKPRMPLYHLSLRRCSHSTWNVPGLSIRSNVCAPK